MFEQFIVQPIFNLLVLLYATIGDFGTAIIIFTIVIRLAMWPLVRRQIHQSRIIRKIQPQIKEIRKRNKGNRSQESMEMMELYKKHGINTFGSIGIIIIQLPVFLGLFSALRSLIDDPERIVRLPYSFVRDNNAVQDMLSGIAEKTTVALQEITNPDLKAEVIERLGGVVSPSALERLSKEELHDLYTQTLVRHVSDADGSVIVGPVSDGFTGAMEQLVQGPFFQQKLFGTIDLSGSALENGTVYIPVLIIAILAGVFQFIQTRQITASNKNAKSIRDILKESSTTGKQSDQSEISAAVGQRMGLFFAPLITVISATSPAGLALYFAASALVGIVQQRFVLGHDLEEMELVADVTEDITKKNTKQDTKKKAKNKKTGKKKSASRKKRKR